MLRLAALLIAAGLVLAPAAHANRVRCDSGRTEFATGALRVFAIHYRDVPGNVEGAHTYACLGARGRPLSLGDNDWGSITGDSTGGTPVLVFSGGRYLAVAHFENGEGGLEDSHYDVLDLRTRRTLTTIGLGLEPAEDPPLRLSANGDAIVTEESRIELYAPRAKKGVPLSAPGADASGAAVSGTTVYWTENGAARTYAASGDAPAGARDTIQAPVSTSEDSFCDARPGTTVAHSQEIRIVRRGGSLSACLGKRSLALPRGAADLQLAHERWVFTGTGVIDLRKRRTVIKLARPRSATLLQDGTLAWIDATGRVLAQSPGSVAPAVLAEAGTALAASGSVVYWTQAGAPHAWVRGK